MIRRTNIFKGIIDNMEGGYFKQIAVRILEPHKLMQMIGTIHSQSHLHAINHVRVRFLIAGTLPATASNYVSNADPRNAEQTHVTYPRKVL